MKRHRMHTLIRQRRKARTRAKIFGTPDRPRLSVFRSNAHIFLQLIDDTTGHTIASASTRELSRDEQKKNPTERALSIAMLLAKRAREKNVQKAIFDRGHYAYHGRVRAIADIVRKELHV